MPVATSRAPIVTNIAHTIITIASVLQLRMWLSLLLLLRRLLLIVLAVRMRYQILMVHLVRIRCGCTVRHRHCCRWRCMVWFVLHRFEMIDLSINRWFFEVIVCRWFVWQLIFPICEFNVIVPCCCHTRWWCWCCYCRWSRCCCRHHRRRRLLTTRRTCSWYSQFGVMQLIASLIVGLRLWRRLLYLCGFFVSGKRNLVKWKWNRKKQLPTKNFMFGFCTGLTRRGSVLLWQFHFCIAKISLTAIRQRIACG